MTEPTEHEHTFEVVKEDRQGAEVVGLEERCTGDGCEAVTYTGTLIPVWPEGED